MEENEIDLELMYEKETGKELSEKKQCDIHVVVKSFYCFDEQNKRMDKCSIQCTTCKSLKLMQ